MGLKVITFVVSQRAAAPPRRTIHPELPRESMAGELPKWGDAGHPAYGKLFQKLRGVFEEDGCLFRDVGLGKQWMLKFIKDVLYPLSTFHKKLARDHRASVPSKFSFSDGANDFAEKKIKAPIMTQETIAAAMDAVATLALSPFLDAGSWASLKAALQELLDNLDKALVSMRQSAAAAKNSRAATGNNGFFSCAPSKEGILYKAKADHVPLKYVELSNELQITSPYVPVSTTGFEPVCQTQRYYWLQKIEVAAPCVVVRINVGSSIGALVWVMKRLKGVSEDDDRGDVAVGRALLDCLVPSFHSRTMQKRMTAALRNVASVSQGFALSLYKEITGDESLGKSEKKKERIAFASRVLDLVGADGDIILDLRALSNAQRLGKTCFAEYWKCTDEMLAQMALAADERRHGGIVAHLSEIISHPVLHQRTLAMFEAKKLAGTVKAEEQAPTLRWLELQFWPSSEYVKAAAGYTGRFPLGLAMQTRQQRKEHKHFAYTRVQNKLVKSFVAANKDRAIYVSVDDKANGAVGEPGTAVSFLSRQRKVATVGGVGTDAMDHDQGHVKTRLVPTVLLVHEAPPSNDGSGTWYRGDVSVSLKDSVVEASEANKACAELERVFLDIRRDSVGASFFIIHADGGP